MSTTATEPRWRHSTISPRLTSTRIGGPKLCALALWALVIGLTGVVKGTGTVPPEGSISKGARHGSAAAREADDPDGRSFLHHGALQRLGQCSDAWRV